MKRLLLAVAACLLFLMPSLYAEGESAYWGLSATAFIPTPTDGPLTNALNLRVVTDASGYLVVSTATYGGTDGPLTTFGNIRLRTDQNGHLLVTLPDASAGAPTDATYIVQTPDATLGAEQAMSLLGTGIVKNTTATGVQSILAIPLTVANGGTGAATLTGLLKGNGTSPFTVATPGTDYGTVTTTGSPTSGQVGYFTGATAVSGGANLTWDGTELLTRTVQHAALTEDLLHGDPPALVVTATGNVENGSHAYYVAFVDAAGLTTAAFPFGSVTVDATHKQVDVAIPVGPTGTVSRTIYRTYANCPVVSCDAAYTLHTVADNTTTTYRDNLSDSVLATPFAPVGNTTGVHLSSGDGGLYVSRLGFVFDVGTGDGSSDPFSNSGQPLSFSVRDDAGQTVPIARIGRYGEAFGFHAGDTYNRYGAALGSGTGNTAIGTYALSQIESGSQNVAVGGFALASNVSAIQNVAVGGGALTSLVSGDVGGQGSNIAIGNQALSSLISNRQNVGIGINALTFTTASYSTCVGTDCLLQATSGDSNTAFGHVAGYHVTTGSTNTFLGPEADVSTGNGAITNATAVGYATQVGTSNTIVLGNSSVTDVYLGSVTGAAKIHATQFLGSGSAPAVTDTSGGNSCGAAGDPSMVSGSTNIAGHFNVGAGGGTDCTLTFTVAAPTKWVCAPSDETSAVLVRAISVDTTTTKFQGVLGAADKVAYICVAY